MKAFNGLHSISKGMARMLKSIVYWGLLLLVQRVAARLNYHPIIGVFAQPNAPQGEYIAASYIKWVESAGAQVVPLPYNATKEQLKCYFKQINGILFPGGEADINDKAEYLYHLAIEANEAGVHFPIFGTCLGMEWLLQMTSGDRNVLDQNFTAHNISMPLVFTDKAKSSQLFGKMPDYLFDALEKRNLTLNNHQSGITPQDFNKHPQLGDFYNVLATNVDLRGVPFVSAIESKKFPIFGLQYHPEKSVFEWGQYPDGINYEVIDHEEDAILASQFLANLFVQHARKNTHKFHDPILEKNSLIYNYHASMISWPLFTQTYVFSAKRYTKCVDTLAQVE